MERQILSASSSETVKLIKKRGGGYVKAAPDLGVR